MNPEDERYEMLDSHDWLRHDPAAVEDDRSSSHEYSLSNLDSDWYPLLREKLAPRDVVDFGKDSGAGDVIDGRGSFDRREMERELRNMRRSELEDQLGISVHKVRDILRRSDVRGDGKIDYKVFLETVRRYRLSTEQESALKSMVRAFAYAEEFTCQPPTVFMAVITTVELVFFLYSSLHLSLVHGLKITWDGPVPFCSVLIYNPYRRYEAWRFLTYMFVHIGVGHFVFNMLMQILVGVFLEMEQEGWMGSLRVASVYLTGVLAGSVGTSISDPDTYIAGASGGVYALIAAHLATLALNWREDSAVKIRKVIHKPLTRIVRLVFILLITVHDVAFAVYVRFYSNGVNRTGFMGHLCGALSGLLVGVFALDNRRVRSWEPCVQWISLLLFAAFVAFGILWNIFGEGFPEQNHEANDDASGNCQHYDYY